MWFFRNRHKTGSVNNRSGLQQTGRRSGQFLSAAAAVILCLSVAFTSVPGSSVSTFGPAAGSTAAAVSLAGGADAGSSGGASLASGCENQSAAIAGTTSGTNAEPSTPGLIPVQPAAGSEKDSQIAVAEQVGRTQELASVTSPASRPESMPAASFSGQTEDTENPITVLAEAPEGAFPAGTTMKVKAVEDGSILSQAENASGLEAGQSATDAANTTKIVKKNAVEITFTDTNGQEIEPAKPVTVSMSCAGLSDAEGDPKIVHFRDDGKTETVEKLSDEELTRKPADDEVVFSSDAFSVYAIVYTVRFHYGPQEYVLPGDSAVMLSSLLSDLKIAKNSEGDLLSAGDIREVRFSDPALVNVTKQGDDWELCAKQPFSTTETLTLTRDNGDAIAVQVTDDNKYDLEQYINKENGVVAEKLRDGQWIPATEFADGDTARITINYSIPNGIITEDNHTITYKLPQGVTVMKGGESGSIRKPSDDSEIGIYTIKDDGTITLDFDKEMNGDAFEGDVQFQSTLHNTSGEEKQKISFGNSGSTITVLKPQESKYDISTAKTGSLSSDGRRMNYTVTTSTTKGTEGTVTIHDAVDPYNSSNAVFSYKTDSIRVVKISSDGNTKTNISAGQYKLTTAGSGTSSKFTIDGLPKLAAGEKYVVTYSAEIGAADGNQYAKVANTASSRSGNNESGGSYTKEMHPAAQKEGSYDPQNNVINWTIRLNEDKTADVSKWTIADATPDEIVGDVVIKDENWQEIAKISSLIGKKQLDVKIADYIGSRDPKGVYRIQYATKVTGGTPGESFTKSNTVTVKDGTNTIGTSTGVVNGTYREAAVSKTNDGADTSGITNGMLYPKWKFTVTPPAGELKSFTYTDTIGTEVTDSDGNVLPGITQYATAAGLDGQLKGHLKLIVDDKTSYQYSGSSESGNIRLKVHYYAGDREVQASDADTHIDKFVVEVATKDNTTFEARQLITDQDYTTAIDISGLQGGQSLKAVNTGSAFDKTSQAEYTYTRPNRFEKQVYQKNEYGTDIFGPGSSTVNYDDIKGILNYRLMLNTTEADNGTITITDVLPAGTSLVDGSVKAEFNFGSWNRNTNDRGTDFNSTSKPQAVTSPNEDGTATLTITIPNYTFVSGYERVAVSYSISLAEDPAWNDQAKTVQTYVNKASWAGNSSSTETKVKRERERVIKSGEQLKDSDGNPTSRVRYTVLINPGAVDLDEDSSTLTLTDTLSGASGLNPSLDISSLKLCNYDPDTENHIGSPLASTSYTLDYDTANATIKMTIPDSKAMVLVYEYNLDDSFADGKQISNAVSLNGNWSSKQEMSLNAQSSSAHAHRSQITLYKVDSRNNQIPLPGTQFKLEQFDKASNSWTVTKSTLTTDSEGKIVWRMYGDIKDLTEDILYRITETKALDGYKLDTTPYYMIWRATASTEDTAFSNSGAGNAGVSQNAITFFSHAGGIFYIRNTYTRVGVQKVWTNSDGSETEAPADVQVKAQLYRQNLLPDGHKVNITVVSTQSPYNKIENSFIVKDGTPISIRFNEWEDNKNVLYVEYGGEKYPMSVDDSANYSYTIHSVNSDLNITIQVKPYNALTPIVDYTKAPNRAANQTAVGDPVTLIRDSSTGRLSYVWDNLDQKDADGNAYYYTVKETAVTQSGKDIAGDYTVSYVNNDGIQSGQIIITNTKRDTPKEYVLPESGGPGTYRYIGTGAMLVIAAAFLYITLLQKRRQGSDFKGGGSGLT